MVGLPRQVKIAPPKCGILACSRSRPFRSSPNRRLRVTFTHDGQRVVAGDWAGQVRMWNTEDAQQVAQLPSNPPTLEMQIAEHQQQLAAARTESDQAAVALKAVQDQVAEVNARATATTQAAESQIQQLREAAAKLRADLDATVAQAATATGDMQAAEKALAEAQRALDMATANLQSAKSKLDETNRRKDALAAALPEADKSAAQAATDAETAKTSLGPRTGDGGSACSTQTGGGRSIQAKVARLEAVIRQLEAEKAAQPPAANQALQPPATN